MEARVRERAVSSLFEHVNVIVFEAEHFGVAQRRQELLQTAVSANASDGLNSKGYETEPATATSAEKRTLFKCLIALLSLFSLSIPNHKQKLAPFSEFPSEIFKCLKTF